MSIADAITSAQNKVAAAYTSCNNMGATMPVPADQNLSNLPATIESIPKGGDEDGPLSDVMFYDYDGTVLYRYTKEEFMALAEMPANPSRPGLTSQGWNWTLEEAQDYVSKYGACIIGQTYVTDDGSTRLYLRLAPGARREVQLSCSSTDGCVVDWGDGSEPDTYQPGAVLDTHTYPHSGNYTIVISKVQGTLTLGSGSAGIFGNAGSANVLYANYMALVKVELGADVLISANCFSEARNLASINVPLSAQFAGGASALSNCISIKALVLPASITSIPSNLLDGSGVVAFAPGPAVTSMGGSALASCARILAITLPPRLTTLPSNLCFAATSCARLVIPNGITGIGATFMRYTRALTSVILPATVTSVGANAFNNCSALEKIYSRALTPPTIAATSFTGTPSTAIFYVPADAVGDYKAATNWSAYADRIYPITD